MKLQEYRSLAGRKVWNDNDNASGLRPDAIIVRLVRNGVVIAEQRVSADNHWQYSFDDLPVYDEAWNPYVYTVSEQPVNGYYAVVSGNDLINVLLTEDELPEDDSPDDVPHLPPLDSSDMADLIYLFDYMVPLYGRLLGTGLEIPAYPFIFAGVGGGILLALLLTKRRKRKPRA